MKHSKIRLVRSYLNIVLQILLVCDPILYETMQAAPMEHVLVPEHYLSEQDYTCLIENSPTEFVYIPQELKSSIKEIYTHYPQLDLLIDRALFLNETTHVVSYESIKKITQQILDLPIVIDGNHDLHGLQGALQIVHEYMRDLESGDARFVLEPLDQDQDDNTVKRNSDTKIYCSLLVRDCLRAGSLKVCGDALICGDLTVKGTIHNDTGSTLYHTDAGNAVPAGGVLNVFGGNNINTTGAGNTITINLDPTVDHAVQVGSSTGGLLSIPVGLNGQVLIGCDNADPAFAFPTSSDGSIDFTFGCNSLDLRATTTGIAAQSFVTDSGTAIPLAGVLNILGGNNINTTGAGNTVTVNLDSTTTHAVQVGSSTGGLFSIPVGTNGQVLMGVTGTNPLFASLTSTDSSITFSTGPGFINLSGVAFGNVVRVDQVFGNDSTGLRNSSRPFLTINAALAAARSGDSAWIFPGTYVETFTIPAGVAVKGLERDVVTISRTGVTTATDLITMSANTYLQDVTLTLTSAEHVLLRGIVFPGSTAGTARVRGVNLTIDNSRASSGGTSNVYGIHSTGVGTVNQNIAVEDCMITVTSIGLGAKRGILVDTSTTTTTTNFNTRDNTLFVRNSGGGSAIGVETNNAAAAFSAKTSTISGSTADISQTLGSLTVVTTDLLNANANGLGFSTQVTPSILTFSFAATGLANTYYMFPYGSTPVALPEIYIRMQQPVIVRSMTVFAGTASTIVGGNTFTLLRNNSSTGLVINLPVNATDRSNTATSVSFAAGDRLAVRYLRPAGGGATLANVIVALALY